MSKSDKILILRFSALGDVAMTVPVVASFLKAYPDKNVVVVSRAFANKLFSPMKGVTFVAIDPNGKHKGVKGLWLLFKTLRAMGPYSFVADLHSVLRTQFLTALFRMSGTKVIQIDKGRKEKKELVRKNNKRLIPLKSTFTRYYEVFEKAGFNFSLDGFDGKKIYLSDKKELPHAAFAIPGHHIGIAPFAGHIWKTWPLEKMKKLVEQLDAQSHQIYLFGGRGKEQKTLESWSHEMDNVHCLAGQLTRTECAVENKYVGIGQGGAEVHTLLRQCDKEGAATGSPQGRSDAACAQTIGICLDHTGHTRSRCLFLQQAVIFNQRIKIDSQPAARNAWINAIMAGIR